MEKNIFVEMLLRICNYLRLPFLDLKGMTGDKDLLRNLATVDRGGGGGTTKQDQLHSVEMQDGVVYEINYVK